MELPRNRRRSACERGSPERPVPPRWEPSPLPPKPEKRSRRRGWEVPRWQVRRGFRNQPERRHQNGQGRSREQRQPIRLMGLTSRNPSRRSNIFGGESRGWPLLRKTGANKAIRITRTLPGKACLRPELRGTEAGREPPNNPFSRPPDRDPSDLSRTKGYVSQSQRIQMPRR